MALVATVIIVVNGKMTFFENYIYNFNTYNSTGDPFNLENSAIITVSGASCNNKCTYCFLNQCTKPSISGLNPEKLVSCIKRFSNDLNKKVTIWAGEPLFNKEVFIKLCDIINTTLPNHVICIYTNGILINDWWADYFRDHKVHIIVSHDGPGQKYRGIDFLESESHMKAIRKMVESGNLQNIETVIHKYNCSFPDIYSFFKKARDEKGIIPKDYDHLLVSPDLNCKIKLDFDYMDPKLIKYAYDNLFFLLKEGSQENYNTIYSGMSSQLISALYNYINPKAEDIEDLLCKEFSDGRFSIDTLGRTRCIRGFFNRDEDKKIKENHINSCSKCDKIAMCPLSMCTAINVNESLCKRIKDRICTLEYVFNEVLSIWQNS